MKHLLLMLLTPIGYGIFFLMTSNYVNGQTEFKEYVSEPLGVKLEIPIQWQVLDYTDNAPENCFSEETSCLMLMMNDEFVSGNISFSTGIEKHSFNGSLKDFLNDTYNTIKQVNGFTFLGDKEIKFKEYPAWQIEYTAKPLGGSISTKYMVITTQVNNTFYQLIYSPNKESDYSKHLQEAQNILNNIEFIPSKLPEEKKPSFLDKE